MEQEDLIRQSNFLRIGGKKSFERWWKKEGKNHSLAIFLPLCKDTNVFRFLLEKNEEDVMWERAFLRALDYENDSFLRVLREFVSFERFLVTKNYSSLCNVIDDGKLDMVHHLLFHGLSPLLKKEEGGFTLWHYACQHGNVDIVKAFLCHNVPVDEIADRRTGLFIACAYWNLEVVKVLIAAGANINRVCCDGVSCLGMTIYTACRFNTRIVSPQAYEIISLLLTMDVNLQLNEKNSPASIFLRGSYQHEVILELLLERDAVPQKYYREEDGRFKDSCLGFPFSVNTRKVLMGRPLEGTTH
jgi:hypothetical protein